MDDDFIKVNFTKPNPNAYLATFAEFLILNKESEYVQKVIKKGLRSFVETMIMQSKRKLKRLQFILRLNLVFPAKRNKRSCSRVWI